MRRATAIGFGVSALLAISACGGGGEGGAGQSPALAEPQASEAVAAAVLSVASVLVELATDPPAVDIGVTGTSEVATALTLCPGGGSLSGTCVLRVHRDSIVRISMRHCGLVDERSGLYSVVDGRLTVQAPYNFCDSGHVPVGGERTYRFDGFTAVLSDGDGVVETFAAERLVESMHPRNTGCEQDDAALDVNGVLAVRRRDGINIALRTAGLHLERSALESRRPVQPSHRGERPADHRRPLVSAPRRGRSRRPRGGRRWSGCAARRRGWARIGLRAGARGGSGPGAGTRCRLPVSGRPRAAPRRRLARAADVRRRRRIRRRRRRWHARAGCVGLPRPRPRPVPAVTRGYGRVVAAAPVAAGGAEHRPEVWGLASGHQQAQRPTPPPPPRPYSDVPPQQLIGPSVKSTLTPPGRLGS